MPKYSQDSYQASIAIDSLSKDVLLLRKMVGTDKVSQPFHYAVEMLKNPGEKVDISSLVGKKASITLKPSLSKGKDRYFHGYVADIRHGGSTSSGLHCYYATIVPWFWFLKKSSKCRIFKGLTVNQILETIFKSVKFASGCYEVKDLSDHPPLEHCVQYQESDFAFASRMMEEFGISYYFEHEESKHKMVLLDSSGKRPKPPPCGFPELEYSAARISTKDNIITHWGRHQQVVSDKYTQIDYNYANKNKFPDIITSEKEGEGKAQGDFAKGDFERYIYDGIFLDDGVSDAFQDKKIEEFKDLAKVRLGSLQAEKILVHGETVCRGVHSGYAFKLSGYKFDPAQDGKEYYVLSVNHRIEINNYGNSKSSGGKRYICTFTAIPKEVEYYPPRLTPKARIYGPQTALVVSDDDKKEKQIYTDKLGRIKVMFHWDRISDRKEFDENSEKKVEVDKNPQNLSCWVRVAQGWAGNKWGSFFLPRVGQEVIVEFLDGDPDRPIVTGSVYNGKMLTPYKLPDNDTVSTIKSDSVGEDGKKAKKPNYNEIRFEDREGSEQIFIHAAKAMDTKILGDRRETVGGNIRLVVGDGKAENSIDEKIGNRVVDIKGGHDVLTLDKGDTVLDIQDGNQHITIGKNQNTKVSGKQTIDNKGGLYFGTQADIHVKSAKGTFLDDGGKVHIKAATGCYLDGGTTVHIKSTSSGTFITSAGDIHIKGKNINIQGTAKVSLAAGPSFVNLGPIGVQIKGPKVDIIGGGSAASATDATAATAATAGTLDEIPKPVVQERLTTLERAEKKEAKDKKINPGSLS